MKWFSFQYVKQNPMLFGGIIIIFGVIFWFLLNRESSSSSSGGGTVSAPQQSEALMGLQIQAGMAAQQGQLQLAGLVQSGQIEMVKLAQQGEIAITLAELETGHRLNELESNERMRAGELSSSLALRTAEIASGERLGMMQANLQLSSIQEQAEAQKYVAGLTHDYQTRELASSERLSSQSIVASLSSMEMQLAHSLAQTRDSQEFAIDYAREGYNANLEQARINAGLTTAMMATQERLETKRGEQSLQAFTLSSLLGAVGGLKKKNRDETLQIIAGQAFGNPVDFTNTPQGTWINPQVSPSTKGESGLSIPGFGAGVIGLLT